MQTLSRMPRTPAATERPASFRLGTAGHRRRHAPSRLPARCAPVAAEGDLIFTTAATGWGEILTDPRTRARSWCSPTRWPATTGSILPSSSRTGPCPRPGRDPPGHAPAGDGLSLEDLLAEAGIPALEGIDTRALTLALRRGAARRAVIRPAPAPRTRAARTNAAPSRRPSTARHGSRSTTSQPSRPDRRHVVAADRSARRPGGPDRLRRQALAAAGARRARPGDHGAAARRHAADVGAHPPDLVVLSPGPGDPRRCTRRSPPWRALAAAAQAGGPPILGVCLGHQLLALAAGAPPAAWRSATTAATTR